MYKCSYTDKWASMYWNAWTIYVYKTYLSIECHTWECFKKKDIQKRRKSFYKY